MLKSTSLISPIIVLLTTALNSSPFSLLKIISLGAKFISITILLIVWAPLLSIITRSIESLVFSPVEV